MKQALLFLCIAFSAEATDWAARGDSMVTEFKNLAAYDCFLQARETDSGLDLIGRLTRACLDVGEDLDSEESEEWYLRGRRYAKEIQKLYPDEGLGFYYDAVAAGRIALFRGGKKKVTLGLEVRDLIDRSLELDDQNPEAWLTRGVYHYEMATLNPVLRLFAKILYGGVPRSDLPTALSDMKESVRLRPAFINAHLRLAKVHYALKDYESCLAECLLVEELPVDDHLDPAHKGTAKALAAKAKKKL